MMRSLNWTIPYKFEVDERLPIFTFHSGDAEFGFYMFSIGWWAETLLMIFAMVLVASFTGFITYKFIVKKQGTSLAYLIGYGVILPFWLSVPYYGVELLDIRNKFMKFCFGAIVPTLGIFHTTEAMYGSQPFYLTTLGSYMHYYGSPMTLKYNTKEHVYVKATLLDLANHLKWFGIYLCVMGICLSLGRRSHYQPFGAFVDQPWYDPSRIWHPAQIGNNLVVGVIFQLFITTAAEGLIATTVLITGYKCERVMENPIFTATSPTEFWGKRWNRLVHSVLKRGVYIPLRKHQVSRALAAGVVFLASGLLHEWILSIVFRPRSYEMGSDGECNLPLCYVTPLGGSTGFFLWNAIIILAEYAIGGSKLVAQFVHLVPAPLRTVMLVMLALPVAHWFCEPYVLSNFFDHSELCFPMIKEIV